MSDLQTVRTKLPALAGLDDDQLIDALHTLYYPQMDRNDLAARLGYKPPEAPVQQAGLLRTAGDVGIKLAQGAVDLGQSVVGLGDLVSGGRVGQALHDYAGYDPKATNDFLGEYLSDSQKAADAKVQAADGFFDSSAASVQNPRSILGSVAESAPGMLAGMAGSSALAGRIGLKAALATTEGQAARAAALASGKSAGQAAAAALETKAGAEAAKAAIEAAGTRLLAAGSGMEGAQSAGQIADQARESGRSYGDYALPAVAAGLGTAGIGLAAGKLMGDSATKIATGAESTGVKGGLAARIGKEFLSEGVLEEMPQSAQEQVFTNMAMGDPLGKGVANAAGTGLVTGGVMGAGLGGFQDHGAHEAPAPAVPEPVQLPNTGPLSQAANAGQAAQAAVAQQAQAAAPTQPAAAPQMSLDDIDKRLEELVAIGRGTPAQRVRDPQFGHATTIPAIAPRRYTPEEEAEYKKLSRMRADRIGIPADQQEEWQRLQAEEARQAQQSAQAATPDLFSQGAQVPGADQDAEIQRMLDDEAAQRRAAQQQEMATTNAIVEHDMLARAAANRKTLRGDILADETVRAGDKKRAFESALQREGYTFPVLNADDHAAIDAHVADTRAATLEQVLQDQGIPADRKAAAFSQALASHGFKDVTPTEADLDAIAEATAPVPAVPNELVNPVPERAAPAPAPAGVNTAAVDAAIEAGMRLKTPGGNVLHKKGSSKIFKLSSSQKAYYLERMAAHEPAQVEAPAGQEQQNEQQNIPENIPGPAETPTAQIVPFPAREQEAAPAHQSREQWLAEAIATGQVDEEDAATIRQQWAMDDHIAQQQGRTKPFIDKKGRKILLEVMGREGSIFAFNERHDPIASIMPVYDVRPGLAFADSHVDEEYRRAGIASAMFDFAEEISGLKMHESGVTSDDARAFWATRRGETPSRTPAWVPPTPTDLGAVRAQKEAAKESTKEAPTDQYIAYESPAGRVLNEEVLQRQNLTPKAAVGVDELGEEVAGMFARASLEQARASFDADGRFIGKYKYRAIPNHGNARIQMFNDLGEAKAYVDNFGRRKDTTPREKRRRLGLGERGQHIFENEHGVRSYRESGFKYEETPGSVRDDNFKTVGELEQERAAKNAFDVAAHEAATSPNNDRPEPTQAQKEAGNYKKGHVRFHGLELSIENPAGSVRKGVDPDGKPWETTMQNHYGDILGTKGADGDPVDVFIGDNLGSERVFVVDQIDPRTGKFDEHKVMLGFDTADEARAAYSSNYDANWKGGDRIVSTDIAGLKEWLDAGKTKKPIADHMPAGAQVADFRPKKSEAQQGAEEVARTLGQMARREHPTTRNARTDRILVAENYVEGIARETPERAAAIAAELRANPEQYSEASGVPPDVVGKYAGVIERYLALHSRKEQTFGRLIISTEARIADMKRLQEETPHNAHVYDSKIAEAEKALAQYRAADAKLRGEEPAAQVEQAPAPAPAAPTLTKQDLNRMTVKDMSDEDLLHARTVLADTPRAPKIEKEIQRRGLLEKIKAQEERAQRDAEARAYWKPGMVTSLPSFSKIEGGQQSYTQMLPGVVESIHGDTANVRIYATPEYGYTALHAPLHGKLAVDVPLHELGRHMLNRDLQRIVADRKLANGDAEVGAKIRDRIEARMTGEAGKRAESAPAPIAEEVQAAPPAAETPSDGNTAPEHARTAADGPKSAQFTSPEFHAAADRLKELQEQRKAILAEDGQWFTGKGNNRKPTEEAPAEVVARWKDFKREWNKASEAYNEALAVPKFGPAAGASTEDVAPIDESIVPITMDKANFQRITDEWADLFAEPARDERVRLDLKSLPEVLDPDAAAAQVEQWKEHVRLQGEQHRSENSRRTVLSLFDLSGEWSKPWREAGYNVIQFDIQSGQDVLDFSVEHFTENYDLSDVYCILAATPCTDFASSGAKHFLGKDLAGQTEQSVKLVNKTAATIEYFRPAVWALENPVGRLSNLTGLPSPRLTFQPHAFGDPYTKETWIWGRFNPDLPTANVAPVEGSKMHSKFGGKSIETKNARSETPEGFAYAFFMANNYIDMPAERKLVAEYPEASGAITEALKAGVPETEIRDLIHDAYGNEDYEDARNALIQAVADRQKAAQAKPVLKESEGYKYVDMTKPAKMFRSVSPKELLDITTRRKVVGGLNRFNGFDRRREVFFGPAITPRLIHQGEEIPRRIENEIHDHPLQEEHRRLYAKVEELTAKMAEKAPGTGPWQAIRALRGEVQAQLDAVAAKLRTHLNERIAQEREDNKSRKFTSAIIETRPIDGGRHYSKALGGVSGMGDESEYGFDSGRVTLDDIERIHLVKDGKIIGEMPVPGRAAEAPAQDADHDDGKDIPLAFYKKVKVPHEVWVEDEGRYETIEVPADKALASVREDIENLRSLLGCMKG